MYNEPLRKVNDKIDWYDKKSISCKKWYTFLMGFEIIISAFIPLASLFIGPFPSTKYIIALMGALITISSGFLATFQFQKKWITYRTTSEILKHHKDLFEIEAKPYNKSDKDIILIENVSTIENHENNNWKQIVLSINSAKKK